MRLENGRLTCKSDVVQGLIRYAETGDPECFNHVSGNEPMRLGMTLEDIATQREELEGMFNSESARLLIGVMRRVMEEGPEAALGPNGRACDLLCEVGSRIRITGDERLAQPISRTLEADRDTKIQLGAALMHELARHKVFGLDTVAFAGLSVSAVPLVDDHINGPIFDRLKTLILRSQNDPARVSAGSKVLLALLESARAFMPEAIDSTLVAKLQDLSSGGSIIPAAEDFLKGVKGGGIATAGSVFTNLLEQFSTGVVPMDTTLKVMAYQVGTFACGAVVPMELATTRAAMAAAWVESIREGRQAPLEAPAQVSDRTTAGRAAVAEAVDRTMAAWPATETMQKQLAWTFLAGLIPAFNEFVWKIDPDNRKTLERTVENPVEVTAYNASVVTDLLVGLPGDVITTDARKSELLFAKILQCGAEGRLLRKVDYERILHPPLEVVGRAGRLFEKGLNGLGSAATTSARALGLARAPQEEDVDFAAAVRPVAGDASSVAGSETSSRVRASSGMV